MSNVKVSIDKESSEHLDHVKKGKPRRFVMLCKGPKILSLVLFKKGAKSTFIKQAKEAGTGEICFGAVGGKGQELLFYLAKADGFEKEPTTNVKLKEFINEATDGSFKPEFRLVDEAPLVLDEEDKKNPLVKRYLFLKEGITDVGERSQVEKAQLAQLYRQARAALEEGDEQTAKYNLDEIDRLLTRDESMPDAPQFVDPLQPVIQELNKLKPAITDVFQRMPEQKPELLSLVEECKRRITGGDAEGAKLALEKVSKFVEEATPKRRLTEALGELAEPIKQALKGPRGKLVEKLLAEFHEAHLLDDYTTAGIKLELLAGQVGIVGEGQIESTASWSKRFEFDEGTGELKNYKVGKELGKGAFGEAKLLQSTGEQGGPRLVAKVLIGGNKDKVHLLKNEHLVYQVLGDHPSLPKCLGVRKVDGKDALLLEAIDGPTMSGAYDQLQGALRMNLITESEYWGAVQHMMRRTLQTLALMEEKQVLHSDIKPENVMIDSLTGEVKVIDLGGATKIGENLSQASPEYAPPEAKGGTGLRLDYKTTNKFDVFSTGKSMQNKQVKSSNQSAYNELLDQMLSVDVNKRPTLQKALAHKFFTDSSLNEEQAREVLQRVMTKKPVQVVEVVDLATWEKAMQSLAEAKMFDIHRAPPVIKEIGEYYRAIAAPENAYNKISRETDYEKKAAAMDNADKIAEVAISAIAQLGDLTGHQTQLKVASDWWSNMRREIAELRKLGPFELTTKNFADKWRKIKSEAKKPFDTLVENALDKLARNRIQKERDELRAKNVSGDDLDKQAPFNANAIKARIKKLRSEKLFESLNSFESFFEFTENFSGALDDFEKAVARKKDVKAKQLAAVTIAKKYYDSVRARMKFKFGEEEEAQTFVKVDEGKGGAMIFALRGRMNDLIASIVKIKA